MIIERKKQFIKNNDLLLITHLTQGEPNVQMRFAPSGGLAAAGY